MTAETAETAEKEIEISDSNEIEVEEFQHLLQEVTGILALLSSPKGFTDEYGFTMHQYLSERRMCAYCMRKTAVRIQKIVRNTGVARTTGGTLGVTSGGLMLGGLIAAPFTGGVSLGLTISGVVTGVSGAATNVTASLVKDVSVKSDLAELKLIQDKVEKKDEKVMLLIQELSTKAHRIKELMIDSKTNISNNFLAKNITDCIGYNIMHKGYIVYSSVDAVKFATTVGELIRSDMMAVQGVAEGIAAPGMNVFGSPLIVAGTQAAKVFGGVLGIFGIVFGMIDIVGGASDFNGSQTSYDLQKAALDMDGLTNQYFQIVRVLQISME